MHRMPKMDGRGSTTIPHAVTSLGPNPVAATSGSTAAEGPPEALQHDEASDAYVLEMPTPPEYPPEALRQNLEGCVLASILVAESGEVKKVEIVAAEPGSVFNQAVIDSQMTARYAAARLNGLAVESRVLAVAGFVLEGSRRLNCALKFAPLAKQFVERSQLKQ